MNGASLALIIIFSALCGASIVTAAILSVYNIRSWSLIPHEVGAGICAAIVALIVICQ